MTQIVRVYAGPDGESHFEDLTPDQFADVANRIGSGDITLNQRQSPTEEDYHNAPRLQYVINLQGDSEYQVSDGTIKRLHPGDILVAEDLEGHGHIARNIGNEMRISLAVPLRLEK